jgi:hypothetical protein
MWLVDILYSEHRIRRDLRDMMLTIYAGEIERCRQKNMEGHLIEILPVLCA